MVDVINLYKFMDDKNNQTNSDQPVVHNTAEVKEAEVVSINNEAEVPSVPSEVETPVAQENPEGPSVENTTEQNVTTPATTNLNKGVVAKYLMLAAVVLVIAVGLIFLLEKEDRINTGLFTSLITKLEAKEPVALVNGVEVLRGDYETSLRQLKAMYAAQGADIEDEEIKQNLSDESLETLINAEILRQEALANGIVSDEERINKRLAEIEESIGGPEALQAKMDEYLVSMESLRRDIENEILIQGLFEKVVIKDITVTDKEIEAFYNESTGPATDLPPLKDVKQQISDAIKAQKEQALIAEFLEEIKAKATIERLI